MILNSATVIGDKAFSGFRSLTSIEIPDSVTTIGNLAFRDCTSLTSIEIPNSVTTIGNLAFSGCTSLTSIVIPDSVTTIGDEAFSGCTSLTSIEIPDSVTSIGKGAFEGCTSLTSTIIVNNNFVFLPRSTKGKYSIPNGIKVISDGAFRDCRSLTSIEIPNSVTSIGAWAFYGSGLQEIHLRNEYSDNVVIEEDYCGPDNYVSRTGLDGLKNCTLYVPIGTGYAYRHDERFKDKFKEIKIERYHNPSSSRNNQQ